MTAEYYANTIHGKRQLLRVSYVRANTKGIPTSLLDFDVSEVDLCFSPADQSNSGAALSEPER
jgi:hypothetical protein